MNNWDWNLDELVDKVMADLRNGDVKLSESNVSVALTRDFRSIRSKKAEQDKNQEFTVDVSSRTASADDKEELREVFTLTERVIFSEIVCKYASQTSKKRWKIGSDAVVTPSAKDELKKRDIELIFENFVTKSCKVPETGGTGNGTFSKSRVTLSASNTLGNNWSTFKGNPQSRTKQIRRVFLANHLPETEKFPLNVHDYLTRNSSLAETVFTCLKEASRQIQSELNKDKSLRIILATHDGAIASVWCNRLSGVRAVAAFSYDQICYDIKATDANVVIVDPFRVGSYQFKRIVDYYLRSEAK